MENFYENSSVHGLKYLSKKFHCIERIFWIFSLFASLVLTIVLITKLIEKVQTAPIIVQISDEQIPITEIDFPATTMCYGLVQKLPKKFRTGAGHHHIRNEKFTTEHYYYEPEEFDEETIDERKLGNFNYIDILNKIEFGEIKIENLGLKILKRLQVIDLVSRRGVFSKLNFSIPINDFLDVTNELTQVDGHRILKFLWIDKILLYLNVLTEKVLCNTFNIALSSDVLNTEVISKDFKYFYHDNNIFSENLEIVIPLKSSRIPIRPFWRIISFNSTRQNTVTNTEGAVLMLHDPYELPTRFSQTMVINEDQITKIYIEPQIMEVDESLYDEDPIKRNCYFDDERELKFFKVYTKANCQFECMSELMITRCGCVEFFMIRNDTTRICSASEKTCFDKVRDEIDGHLGSCGCLERCNYIKYKFDVETSESSVLFWTFFITLSLTLCALMIKNIEKQTWTKSYDDSFKFEDKILFPAITILPARFADSEFYNKMVDLTIEWKKYYMYHDKKWKEDYFRNETKIFECLNLAQRSKVFDPVNFKPYNLASFHLNSKLNWFKQQYAIWNDKYQVNFTELRTLYGLGFSFNLMDSQKLFNYEIVHDEFKYKRNISMLNQAAMLEIKTQNYPLKVDVKSHSKLTLKIVPQKQKNSKMKVCLAMALNIHSPFTLPTFSYFRDFGEIKQSMDVEITPEITKTGESLKALTPNERECYFTNEKKLKYFKFYTQENCEKECTSIFYADKCKCLHPGFIYERNRTTDFCNWEELSCVKVEDKKELDKNCSCLPTCDALTYHIKYYPKDDENNAIVINIKMNSDDLILYRRFQLFTFSDAVSYAGGLFGLFAGISMLSIVEILYFLTLRVFVNVFKKFRN